MDKKDQDSLVYFAYNPIEVNHSEALDIAKQYAEPYKVIKIYATSKGLRHKLINFRGNDADAYGHDLHLYDTLTSKQPISVGRFD